MQTAQFIIAVSGKHKLGILELASLVENQLEENKFHFAIMEQVQGNWLDEDQAVVDARGEQSLEPHSTY